jgi:hypothetical protein
MPDKDGYTIRQSLEKVWKQTGHKPALLDEEPEIYPALQHIWTWFHHLSSTRGGGFGPAPISFQEIDAWARLMRTGPTPWEIEQIMRLDGVWFKVQAEKDKKDKKTDEK